MWGKMLCAVVAAFLVSWLTEMIFRKWPKTGKWAITSGTASCPHCGLVPQPVRIPQDQYEMLWGGNTCRDCGTKFDKHGELREV